MNNTAELQNVAKFRQACLANEYRPVSVETAGKAAIAKNWTSGEDPRTLLAPNDRYANTGIVLHGLRAIDVDVDDVELVTAIKQVILQEVPPDALFRVRQNSHRFAVVVRAESDNTEKLVVAGAKGKVEFLGSRQQLVANGLHPSGVTLAWRDDRSPATVPVTDLPVVTEAKVHRLLHKFNLILGNSQSKVDEGPSKSLTARGNVPFEELNSELSGGLSWFDRLLPVQMSAVVKTCLSHIDNTVSDPRDRWLNVIFAAHHAEDLGCTNARELACDWSRLGKGWTGDDAFDKAWDSYRPGGVRVGTLLHLGRGAGVDLNAFREMITSCSHTPKDVRLDPKLGSSKSFILPRRLVDLAPTPGKRQWLHGTDLVRGAISLLVSPGGRGKSTWLIHLALACATNRNLLGATVFGGPLRVLYINAEDGTEELNRRFSAAIKHHGVDRNSLSNLLLAGAEDARFSLLEAQKGLSQLSSDGWQTLHDRVAEFCPDVVIIDPLVACVGGANLNDNSAAAMMMAALTKLASEKSCSVMIAHHTSKNTNVTNQEAAMGAASLVNMSRISLAVETMTEEQAPKLGVMMEEAKSYFRVVSAKQNMSPPAKDGRWFRIVPMTLNNAMPPTYIWGDDVAVIERFAPTSLTSTLSSSLMADLRNAVKTSYPPLSPGRRSQTHSAATQFAAILSAHRNRPASDSEGQALVKELLSKSIITVVPVTVARKGRSDYQRDGLAWCDGMSTPDNAKQMIGGKLVIGGLEASQDATKQ
jgi:hypothetical protein